LSFPISQNARARPSREGSIIWDWTTLWTWKGGIITSQGAWGHPIQCLGRRCLWPWQWLWRRGGLDKDQLRSLRWRVLLPKILPFLVRSGPNLRITVETKNADPKILTHCLVYCLAWGAASLLAGMLNWELWAQIWQTCMFPLPLLFHWVLYSWLGLKKHQDLFPWFSLSSTKLSVLSFPNCSMHSETPLLELQQTHNTWFQIVHRATVIKTAWYLQKKKKKRTCWSIE
jgi:hypothetical protein